MKEYGKKAVHHLKGDVLLEFLPENEKHLALYLFRLIAFR